MTVRVLETKANDDGISVSITVVDDKGGRAKFTMPANKTYSADLFLIAQMAIAGHHSTVGILQEKE